jgi:hypothetical protein
MDHGEEESDDLVDHDEGRVFFFQAPFHESGGKNRKEKNRSRTDPIDALSELFECQAEGDAEKEGRPSARCHRQVADVETCGQEV